MVQSNPQVTPGYGHTETGPRCNAGLRIFFLPPYPSRGLRRLRTARANYWTLPAARMTHPLYVADTHVLVASARVVPARR